MRKVTELGEGPPDGEGVIFSEFFSALAQGDRLLRDAEVPFGFAAAPQSARLLQHLRGMRSRTRLVDICRQGHALRDGRHARYGGLHTAELYHGQLRHWPVDFSARAFSLLSSKACAASSAPRSTCAVRRAATRSTAQSSRRFWPPATRLRPRGSRPRVVPAGSRAAATAPAAAFGGRSRGSSGAPAARAILSSRVETMVSRRPRYRRRARARPEHRAGIGPSAAHLSVCGREHPASSQDEQFAPLATTIASASPAFATRERRHRLLVLFPAREEELAEKPASGRRRSLVAPTVASSTEPRSSSSASCWEK